MRLTFEDGQVALLLYINYIVSIHNIIFWAHLRVQCNNEKVSMLNKNLKHLAEQVHKLKPIVMIGNKGLTETVHTEIDQSLDHHELIKIRIASGDKEYRENIIQEICQKQQAVLIKKIGHVFAIYRKRKQGTGL